MRQTHVNVSRFSVWVSELESNAQEDTKKGFVEEFEASWPAPLLNLHTVTACNSCWKAALCRQVWFLLIYQYYVSSILSCWIYSFLRTNRPNSGYSIPVSMFTLTRKQVVKQMLRWNKCVPMLQSRCLMIKCWITLRKFFTMLCYSDSRLVSVMFPSGARPSRTEGVTYEKRRQNRFQ